MHFIKKNFIPFCLDIYKKIPTLKEIQEEMKLDRLNLMIKSKIKCLDLTDCLMNLKIIIIEKIEKIKNDKGLEVQKKNR